MPELTIGFSSCPNDTFIFDAMVNGKIDCEGLSFNVTMDDVEALNEMATSTQLDITKLSYHAYAFVSNDYILMHSGSALGRGCGPLVITKKLIESDNLSNTIVAIPGKMTTAHFLFNLFYPKVREKKFMRFDAIEKAVLSDEGDAGVIIHENRFTYKEKGLTCLRDLGQAWESKTALPIPLGGIAIKRHLDPELQQKVQRCIKKSVEYAFENPQASKQYVREHAQEMDVEVTQQHIDLYVNQYSVDLGKDGIAAVEGLFTMAENLKLVEKLRRPILI